jgi:diacylglycerol kinase family enzyme
MKKINYSIFSMLYVINIFTTSKHCGVRFMTFLFIINPFAANNTLSEKLRENINSIEELKNKNILIFNSEYPGHETVLVNQVMNILQDEDFFIFVCGGKGSFACILDANIDFEKTKITMFPCGATNDNLKIFSRKAIPHFTNIPQLINGTTLHLDYIKTTAGNAFNTVSCGYSSKIIEIHKKFAFFSIFNPSLIWFIAGFFGIVSYKASNFQLTIDDNDYSGYYHEIICANGNTQGGGVFLGKEIKADDGLLNFILIPKMNVFSLIKTVIGFYTHNPKLFNKKVVRFSGKKFSFSKVDKNKKMKVNFDGELKNTSKIDGEIIPNILPFVVPQEIAEKYKQKSGAENA